MEEKFFTINEVAEILGLHHKTIRGFISDGKLSAIKAGKQWRIKKVDLDHFMGLENNQKPVTDRDNMQINIDGESIQLTTENPRPDTKTNRIRISTVIDIKEVDKVKFERISNTLLALMNSKDETFEHATVHMKYDESGNQCKILLWGNSDYIREMISIVTILDEEKNR
ncbi:helix-turn-helix domain-containing protein [Lachnospiraceae bacterium 54-53]